jgi:hypothetical protein
MSYDVSIGRESFNYTYNVHKLFHDHMDGGIQSLDGLTGKQAFLQLAECIDGIDRTRHNLWENVVVGEPVFCHRYDAPNGWGSAIGGILFLSLIMAACARNPRSKVRVS